MEPIHQHYSRNQRLTKAEDSISRTFMQERSSMASRSVQPHPEKCIPDCYSQRYLSWVMTQRNDSHPSSSIIMSSPRTEHMRSMAFLGRHRHFGELMAMGARLNFFRTPLLGFFLFKGSARGHHITVDNCFCSTLLWFHAESFDSVLDFVDDFVVDGANNRWIFWWSQQPFRINFAVWAVWETSQ